MVRKLSHNYSQQKESDYSLVPGNKSLFDLETDYVKFSDNQCTKLKNNCNINSIVKAQGKFRKFVYGC